MPDVTIYGASDDLIEVEGDVPGCDEYGGEHGEFIVRGTAGAVRVCVDFVTNGCWMVGVAPTEDGTPMLPVAIDHMPNDDEPGYSARAVVSDARAVDALRVG